MSFQAADINVEPGEKYKDTWPSPQPPPTRVVSFLRTHYGVNEGDTLCWVTET